MKWIYPLLAVALTAVFGLPFREYDTARLLPIKTVQVEKTENGVRLISEIGSGEGEDWSAAVDDLRKNAPGEVFFDTAEQVVFCDRSLVRQVVDSGELRPAAQVYYADAPTDPEGLNDYLSAHESGVTVAELRAGEGR